MKAAMLYLLCAPVMFWGWIAWEAGAFEPDEVPVVAEWEPASDGSIFTDEEGMYINVNGERHQIITYDGEDDKTHVIFYEADGTPKPLGTVIRSGRLELTNEDGEIEETLHFIDGEYQEDGVLRIEGEGSSGGNIRFYPSAENDNTIEFFEIRDEMSSDILMFYDDQDAALRINGNLIVEGEVTENAQATEQ